MEYATSIIAALAPSVLLFFYVYWSDRQKPEPLDLLFACFRFGALAGIFAAFAEVLVTFILSPLLGIPMIGSVLKSFLVAGCCEEGVKLLTFHLLVRKNKYFDEYFDGIVYCVTIGMGFAALENVVYIVQANEDWPILAIMRAIFSVPGHFAFAVIMGYLYALVHFDPEHNKKLIPWVFLAPVIAHGIYDTLCFWQTETLADYPLMSLLIFVMLIVFCIKMHKWVKNRFDFLLYVDNVKDAKPLEPNRKNNYGTVIICVIIAIVSIFLLLLWYAEKEDEAFKKYQEGYALAQENKYDEAFQLYQESADGGSSDGINAVGICYEYGRGVNQNYTLAFQNYKKAADMDNYFSKYNLARFYLKGISTQPDTAIARELFEQATDYVDSNIYLGLIYQYGYRGFEPDEARALECYDRAEGMGSGDGKFAADALRAGLKIPFPGFFECSSGFKKFAEGMYRSAVTSLGDAKVAGNTAALSLMAYAAHTGQGIEQDDDIAYYYCLEGAERGDEICLGYLGDFYLRGIHVKKDTLKALQYYLMAPHSYHALFALAELYETGAKGIPVDTVKANQCLNEARSKEQYIKLYKFE